MKKVCFISCFFGPLPDYFEYFIRSANYNKEVDFVVLSNQVRTTVVRENVRIIAFDIAKFNVLASEKLGITISINYAFKLCDFKPAYGIIFEDLLKDYDFWACCDIDIIWGNIRKFFTDELLNNFDVIRTKPFWITGHCTIFRNIPNINMLFKVSPDWKEVFSSDNYFQFDESCRRWDGKEYAFEELTERGEFVSLYDVVIKLDKEKKITTYVLDRIREYPDKINYYYNRGTIIDLSDNCEILYYHLLTVKKLWRFYITPYKTTPEEFYVYNKGIISSKDRSTLFGRIKWSYKRTIDIFPKILQSIKSQGIIELVKKFLYNNEERTVL